MSKLSRRVGVGLVKFGEAFQSAQQTRRLEERSDARLEKEDAFKERELSIRERESEIRVKNLERQGRLDEGKLLHANLVRDMTAAGQNHNLAAAAYSRWFPDNRNYTVNKEKARDMTHEVTGKPAFMVWDVSYNDTNARGQLVPDETTGKTKQKPGPNGPRIFWTQDEYAKFLGNTMNPDAFQAFAINKQTDKAAYDSELSKANAITEGKLKAQEKFRKTPEGIAATKRQKAETERIVADTGRLERSPAAGGEDKRMSKMRNLPGHEEGETSNLTVMEMKQFQKDADSKQENLPGITAQEVRYTIQGNEKHPMLVENSADLVVKRGGSDQEINTAAANISKAFKISHETAKNMLRVALRGRKGNKPGFFKRFFQGSPSEEQQGQQPIGS